METADYVIERPRVIAQRARRLARHVQRRTTARYVHDMMAAPRSLINW